MYNFELESVNIWGIYRANYVSGFFLPQPLLHNLIITVQLNISGLVQKLSGTKQTTSTESELFLEENEVETCGNIKDYKILPNDDYETVRKKHGLMVKCYMDERADPCEKFYDYACGNWNSFHPIPRDQGGYDTFEILREDLDVKLISMLEEKILNTDNNATSAAKTLYSSCMNMSK